MTDETASRIIDEDARRRFESALRENPRADVAEYLPAADDNRYLATLEELVVIDLEFRWKNVVPATPDDTRVVGPLLEGYLERFPDLQHDIVLARMVAEECWIRRQCGDQPTRAEYRSRFPTLQLSGEMIEMLADAADRPFAIPQPAAERFEMLSEHARGGMGVVLRARDRRFDREVAVKQLAADLANSGTSRQRFVSEANIAARLEHPGVVPVYDFGVADDGAPYYAMKLVRGETLTELIRKHHDQSPASRSWRLESLRLLNTLISVARTVAFAHSRGVIHRDLKPDNIIVGDFGETVLLDWGLAKSSATSEATKSSPNVGLGEGSATVDIQLTQDGALLGTPMYMAPEQALGQIDQLDERTDVYALGVVLYQILTGHAPFQADTVGELMERIATQTPRRPRMTHGTVPRPLEAICLKALMKARSDRYQTVEQMIEDLERYEADESVEAFREPLWWKAARWIKRHRTLVTVSAISLLLISAAAVLGFIQWDRARQQQLRFLAEMRAAAQAAEESSRQAIRDGRYALALTQLDHALATTSDDASLKQTRDSLAALREPLRRLIRFRQLADRAEQLAFFDRDRDGLYLMQRAFDQIHVFEHWDWWDHLTPLELSPRHLDRLRQDVYRLQLLLTAVRMKLALLESMSVGGMLKGVMGGNQNAKRLYRLARQSAQAADRFRHADATRIAIHWCRYQLGETRKVPSVSSFNPRNETDNYMIGLCLLYAHVFSDSPLAKPLLKLANLKEPLETSRVMLTNASLFEPEYYWNAVWYGWASETSGDFATALVAYTRCVALRPDYSFSYVNRAEALVKLGTEAKKQRSRWLSFMRRALRDLQRAADLDPGDPVVRWKQAYCYNNIPNQAIAEITTQLHAVQLEPPLEVLPPGPRRDVLVSDLKNSLKNGRNISKALPKTVPPWLLRAFCCLRLGQLKEADASVDEALKLQTSSAEAHIIKGEILLASGKPDEARHSFQEALRRHEASFLAQWGLARLSNDNEEAVTAYEAALKLARNDWQKIEAIRGKTLALVKLKRIEQAYQLLQTAEDISPTLDVAPIVKAVREQGQNELADRIDDLNHGQVRQPKVIEPAVGMSAPLLNGGFELGLARHWGETALGSSRLRPVWFNVGNCQSLAEATSTERFSGRSALRIQNSTPEGKNVFGATQQRLPVIRGATYRVSLMAKARNLGPKSFHVVISTNKNRVIKLDTGTYDWKKFSGNFSLQADEAIVRLRMRTPGTVWIDDLKIELLRLPSRQEADAAAKQSKPAKKPSLKNSPAKKNSAAKESPAGKDSQAR